MDDLTHFYQVLGLKPGATFEEVKTVYRDLVKVWHPDRFSHDERLQIVAQEKLKEINGAYKMLEAHFFEASIQPEAPPASQGEPAAPAPDAAASPSTTRNQTALWAIVIVLVVAVAAGGALIFEKKKSAQKPTNTEPATPVTVPAAKLSQYALSFDGNRSRIAITMPGSLSGTFTVECWALSRRSKDYGIVLSSAGPRDFGFDISFREGNRFHLELGDGTHWLIEKGVNAMSSYRPDEWYHVAWVVTPGSLVVYVNGKNVRKHSIPATGEPLLFDADHQVSLGANILHNGEHLDGCIADVRIWNTARTEDEIKSNLNTPLTGNEPGLQSYWPFKEGSGTNTVDASGHGFSAQLVGNISWSTNLPAQLTLK